MLIIGETVHQGGGSSDERLGPMGAALAYANQSAGSRAHVPQIPQLRLVSSHADTVPGVVDLDGRDLPALGDESATSVAFTFPAGDRLHVHCARKWLGHLLERAWDGDAAERVTLAAYEVIANAGIHGTGIVRLAVVITDDDLVMDVVDDSPAMPRPRQADQRSESGRGLAMVELLGGGLAAWPLGAGKLVRLRIGRKTSNFTTSAGWEIGAADG